MTAPLGAGAGRPDPTTVSRGSGRDAPAPGGGARPPSADPILPAENGGRASQADDEARLEEEAAQAVWRESRQILIMVVAIGAFMAAAHFTPLRAWLTNVQVWKDYVREFGWLAHAVFGAVCAVAVMVGVPRLPLCAAAGLAFGFWQGTFLSLAGSTVGSYGAFLTARCGGRRAAVARAARWPWLQRLLARPSLAKVFWVRQIMMPGLILNVLLGVTAVRHRVFLAGTLLGYAPLTVAFALGGSALGKGSLAHTFGQLLGAVAIMNVAGLLVWRTVRAHRAAAAANRQP